MAWIIGDNAVGLLVAITVVSWGVALSMVVLAVALRRAAADAEDYARRAALWSTQPRPGVARGTWYCRTCGAAVDEEGRYVIEGARP